jgi:hypothetical protein
MTYSNYSKCDLNAINDKYYEQEYHSIIFSIVFCLVVGLGFKMNLIFLLQLLESYV